MTVRSVGQFLNVEEKIASKGDLKVPAFFTDVEDKGLLLSRKDRAGKNMELSPQLRLYCRLPVLCCLCRFEWPKRMSCSKLPEYGGKELCMDAQVEIFYV
jgi:hypothetical protein